MIDPLSLAAGVTLGVVPTAVLWRRAARRWVRRHVGARRRPQPSHVSVSGEVPAWLDQPTAPYVCRHDRQVAS